MRDPAGLKDQVIAMRMTKHIPVRTIAKTLDLDMREVTRILSEYREEVKTRNVAIVEQRYLEHDELLEHLIAEAMARLTQQWDIMLVRLVVTLLERQAKLHGLDKGASNSGQPVNNWMTGKTDTEVIAQAKIFGLPIPEKFALYA